MLYNVVLKASENYPTVTGLSRSNVPVNSDVSKPHQIKPLLPVYIILWVTGNICLFVNLGELVL